MSTTPQRKSIQIKARITEAQHADLQKQARHAGLNLSDLIRQRMMNKHVISSADESAAKSIDKVGRMLKHLYPKDKAWANAEDKKRWWRVVEELQATARDIRRGGKT
jgi:hypothetical protein